VNKHIARILVVALALLLPGGCTPTYDPKTPEPPIPAGEAERVRQEAAEVQKDTGGTSDPGAGATRDPGGATGGQAPGSGTASELPPGSAPR
jgi:hypothetical protein